MEYTLLQIRYEQNLLSVYHYLFIVLLHLKASNYLVEFIGAF